MKRLRGIDRIWFGAILALAAALRLWHLNAPLWHDEIQTLVTHVNLGWGEMVRSYSMNHHYLHNLAVKLSMTLFGDAPWVVRLPAMLFGLGTIWAVWALAREIAGVKIAHLTALLLALSYHQIWFSQNARGYTGLAFFSTLGMLYFQRGMRQPTRRTWLLYGLTLAAAVFTHLTGAFFFFAQGIVWLVTVITRTLRGRLDRAFLGLPLLGFLVGGIVTLALYAPLLPSLLDTVSSVSETSAGDVMQEYQSPLWTAFEAIRSGIGSAGPLVALVGAAVVILSILGAIAIHRDAPLFAPATFLHIAVTVGLLMAVGMRIWPRFFFVDIGFLMFLIVMGVQLSCAVIGHFIGGERLSRALFALAAVAMVAISALLAARNYTAPKQDLAGAFQMVEGMRQPGDRVVALGYAGENFGPYFHADWAIAYTDADYRAALAAPGRVYLVVGFPERVFRDIPAFDSDRKAGLTELRIFPGTLGDGAVIVYRRD
ncbi:MAG: glycosyltransferase family 39 protein [Rhodobacteraceae bacterium]|nr:glycosyltransferase family 39 protein [Paracoccaceae bacterium]